MAKLSDLRERMANQLLMRGHASMKEILTASFGEWPPQGLDINPDLRHDQRVDFKPLAGISTFGMATFAGEREIDINNLLCCTLPRLLGKSFLNSIMGHEAVHILQGDHFWRAEQTFSAEMARNIWMTQKGAASIHDHGAGDGA